MPACLIFTALYVPCESYCCLPGEVVHKVNAFNKICRQAYLTLWKFRRKFYINHWFDLILDLLSKLCTVINAISNASFADVFFPQTGAELPQILALRIAAKPLQLATWLLLTGYTNLPTVPSQVFSQPPTNTCSLKIEVPIYVLCPQKVHVARQYGRQS